MNIILKICKHTCKIYGATLLVSGISLTSRVLTVDGKGVSAKISSTTLNRIASPKIKYLNLMIYI